MAISKIKRSGYTDCPCRDCFNVSMDDELCSDCDDAGCDPDGNEDCQAPGAYDGDDE